MMATVRHVTSSSGLRKFQADGFLFVGVYVKKPLGFKRLIKTVKPEFLICVKKALSLCCLSVINFRGQSFFLIN